MEENNNIFLAGGGALVYLPGPKHKKYFTTFVWGHPFSTYVSKDQFFNHPPPLLPCTQIYTLRETVTAVGLFRKVLLNTVTYMY